MKNLKYLFIVVVLFSFTACTSNEVVTEIPVVEDYTDLSVCGDFADYEVATDAGAYLVARSAENGDCLFMLSATSSRNDGECAFDEMEHMVNPNQDCIISVTKYYNLEGEEIEEVEIAASKPIWQEDYTNAITK